MIASVMLAVSVIGVSGMILSSYAHDEHSAAQNEAIATGEALMEELSALPFTAGSSDDVGLADFASYSDTTTSGVTTVATAKKAQTKGKSNLARLIKRLKKNADDDNQVGLIGNLVGLVNGLLSNSNANNGTPPSSTPVATTATPLTASRAVSVARMDTLNGAPAAAGDLALVTVDVTMSTGQVMRIRRLVSSTEAASTTAAANRY